MRQSFLDVMLARHHLYETGGVGEFNDANLVPGLPFRADQGQEATADDDGFSANGGKLREEGTNIPAVVCLCTTNRRKVRLRGVVCCCFLEAKEVQYVEWLAFWVVREKGLDIGRVELCVIHCGRRVVLQQGISQAAVIENLES
jgi:hypothetical protein